MWKFLTDESLFTCRNEEQHTSNKSQTGTDTDIDIDTDTDIENGFRVLDQLTKLKADEAVLCY